MYKHKEYDQEYCKNVVWVQMVTTFILVTT